MNPPVRSRISGFLALVACAACCALPLLIAGGLLTTAGAAVLQYTLVAVAAGLAVLALGMWWLHERARSRPAAAADGSSCGCGTC
jgi:mercuric ion transport protein